MFKADVQTSHIRRSREKILYTHTTFSKLMLSALVPDSPLFHLNERTRTRTEEISRKKSVFFLCSVVVFSFFFTNFSVAVVQQQLVFFEIEFFLPTISMLSLSLSLLCNTQGCSLTLFSVFFLFSHSPFDFWFYDKFLLHNKRELNYFAFATISFYIFFLLRSSEPNDQNYWNRFLIFI